MKGAPDIRVRARLHATRWTDYRVSVANGTTDLSAAFRLVHDSYVELGICTPQPSKMRLSPQHLHSRTVVLLARRRAAPGGAPAPVVGTVSVIPDGHAGLPLASDYPEPIAALRRRGARLCEIGALAVDADHRRRGPNPLLAMAALWAARSMCAATHCVIGVHPKSAGYYTALYGFQCFGAPRRHSELDAPVTALLADLWTLGPFLASTHPEPMSGGRSVREHVCGACPGWVDPPDSVICRARAASPPPRALREATNERR